MVLVTVTIGSPYSTAYSTQIAWLAEACLHGPRRFSCETQIWRSGSENLGTKAVQNHTQGEGVRKAGAVQPLLSAHTG